MLNALQKHAIHYHKYIYVKETKIIIKYYPKDADMLADNVFIDRSEKHEL